MSNPTVTTLKQGICAYNYGNYHEALAHFELVAQNSPEPMMQAQAKKNLIKTYKKLERMEEAIELCQSFVGHPVYDPWAVRTLKKFGVMPHDNTSEEEEIDGELSAPLLPPELEVQAPDRPFYVKVYEGVKSLFHKETWGRFFSFLG